MKVTYLDYLFSIISLIISIVALLITALIYKKQKNEAIIQSFFNDFALFLAYSGQGNYKDARIKLTKLKLQVGFLTPALYAEFISILPIIEHLNLTPTNPSRDSDWAKIQNFIFNFTKSYNKKTTLTKQYLIKIK